MLILERINSSATLKSRPVFIKVQNYKVRRLYFARFSFCHSEGISILCIVTHHDLQNKDSF
jgi:hypothetical protein